jgi:hypothetical protein
VFDLLEFAGQSLVDCPLEETADELRANSHLKAAEYSIPVLGWLEIALARQGVA